MYKLHYDNFFFNKRTWWWWWPWTTLNPDFKGTLLFDVNISETVQDRRSNNGIVIGTKGPFRHRATRRGDAEIENIVSTVLLTYRAVTCDTAASYRAQIFVINKCSHKIVLTRPALTPTPSAISCTLTRRFCNTTFSTAWQFSSQSASCGRPDRGSSWKLLLPRRNSAAQCLARLHRIQQSFVCVRYLLRLDIVSKILTRNGVFY